MKLRVLAAFAAMALVAGCGPVDFWNKPAAEEPSRDAAMSRCRRELDAKLPGFIKEHSDPKISSSFLASDEYREIEITQSICQAASNDKFKDMGYVIGYLEWIEKGTEKYPSDTKVEKVIVVYPINYPLTPG